MPGYSHLLIGDLHGREFDLEDAVFDIVAINGDIIDEEMGYSEQKEYLKKFKRKVNRKGVKGIIYCKGNHEKKCIKNEKLYQHVSGSKKRKGRLTLEEVRTISNIKIEGRKTIEGLINEIGIVGKYIGISDKGAVIPGKYKGPHNVYVLSGEKIPSEITSSKNVDEIYYLSHHKNLGGFRNPKIDTYFHGHRHDFYENGDRISTGVVYLKPGKKARVRPLSFDLNTEELRKCRAQTPGIFFVYRGGRKRGLEILPGIFGDWMVVQNNNNITYHSAITKKTHYIDVNSLERQVRSFLKH